MIKVNVMSSLLGGMRGISFLILLLLVQDYLFPIYAGRTKTENKSKIKWIYGENKDSRTIAFIEFENLSPQRKEIYDSYKSSLPRIIAERIQNNKSIESPSNDFIPILKKVSDSYLVKEISFADAEKNSQLMDEVFRIGTIQSIELINQLTNENETSDTLLFTVATNFITNQTSLGEVVSTNIVTNQTQVNIEDLSLFSTLTNKKVAYYSINQENRKYVFYIFKEDPKLYFDPRILVPYKKYFVSNDLFLPTTIDGQDYYPIDKNKKKKFVLSPKLYRLNDAPLGNILNQKNIDYFVFGSFKVIRNQMELSLYVIHSYEKKITHIYHKKFSSSDVREKIKQLDILILSFLQKKNIILNTQFSSQPTGGFLRLNDRFIGAMPQTLSQWVEGKYIYEVWYPNQNVSQANSDNTINERNIEINKSDTQTKFFFKSEEKGILDININNGIQGDYYLNSKLIGKNKSSYSDELFPGEYFVRISKSNYVTRNFKINVEPSTRTSLSFGIKKNEPKNSWRETFLDYGRNTKIFGAIGLGLGAASFGIFIHTLRLEDKKNSSQKRIEELTENGLDPSDEQALRDQYSKEYNKYLAIGLGVFSGGIISLITMLTFHTLDVFDKHAPIETTFNHRGDVEIKYTKDL